MKQKQATHFDLRFSSQKTRLRCSAVSSLSRCLSVCVLWSLCRPSMSRHICSLLAEQFTCLEAPHQSPPKSFSWLTFSIVSPRSQPSGQRKLPFQTDGASFNLPNVEYMTNKGGASTWLGDMPVIVGCDVHSEPEPTAGRAESPLTDSQPMQISP